MRILMIGWFADRRNSGGMEVHIRELCKNLTLSGHSVSLIVPDAAQSEMKDVAADVRYINCEINSDFLEVVIKSVKQYNEKIISEFSNSVFDFDAIHSHDWLGVMAAKYLSEKYKKPWIHTVHSLEHIRATEDTKSAISKIERLGITGCGKIIAVSGLMKKEILQKYRVAAEKISVIYNYSGFGEAGVTKLYDNPTAILFVGRLAFQKGIEHLILAFQKVLKEFPSANLIIAGGGNMAGGLKSLASTLGIEASVIFSGHVNEKKLKELYLSAALFVSPSVFEPFGITVLDAVNFGVPVVATKNTGCLELFSKGSIAIAEPENSGDISDKIIRLLKNKNETKKIVESAKMDLEKADDWERIAKKTADIYASA